MKMKTLKEAQKYTMERLEDENAGESLEPLNDKDFGKRSWRFGKYDMIHILAYIYGVETKDVKLEYNYLHKEEIEKLEKLRKEGKLKDCELDITIEL